MGAGAAAGTGLNRKRSARWSIAWIFTLPAAGVVGFLAFKADPPARPLGLGRLIAPVAILLTWAGRLMLHAENADDIAAMLPTDEAELHEFHPARIPTCTPTRAPRTSTTTTSNRGTLAAPQGQRPCTGPPGSPATTVPPDRGPSTADHTPPQAAPSAAAAQSTAPAPR